MVYQNKNANSRIFLKKFFLLYLLLARGVAGRIVGKDQAGMPTLRSQPPIGACIRASAQRPTESVVWGKVAIRGLRIADCGLRIWNLPLVTWNLRVRT